MIYREPIYFNDFKCIADKCPDTCCSGWQIVIDDDTLDRYEALVKETDNAFAAKICDSVDFQEGCYRQRTDRSCYMLRPDGLCEQVLMLGEESLCSTCHIYPRHVEEFEDVREWSLSLSCPEAVRIVLTAEKGLQIVEKQDDKEDPLIDEFEDFDIFLYTHLESVRIPILALIRNENFSINHICYIMLKAGRKMQEALDNNRIGDIEMIMEMVLKESDYWSVTEEQLFEMVVGQGTSTQLLYDFLHNLERLNDDWEDYILPLKNHNITQSIDIKDMKQWDVLGRNLLETLVYTWFLGAVYDDEIYAKLAMSVFCYKAISNIILARSKVDGDNGIEMWLDVARRFMREIEHSDENLNAVETFVLQYLE